MEEQKKTSNVLDNVLGIRKGSSVPYQANNIFCNIVIHTYQVKTQYVPDSCQWVLS